MTRRRVVVTGLGVISTVGNTVADFWDALRRGQSGIAPMDLVDRTRLRFQQAAEVRGYRPEDHFGKRSLLLLDRFAQFGLVAAREAVADSGLTWTPALQARAGVVTGSSLGGQTTQDDGFFALYREGRAQVNPVSIPRVMPNAAASHIAMEFGLSGPAYTLSTACSSSTHAIGHAFWMVRSGLVDLAVAGGSEAPFSYGHLKSWEAMRVIAPDTCRPFSMHRKGMILGEGGAMLVLEALEAARARAAPIYGEVVGFGMSADAHHITQPLPEGAARAIRAALHDADLRPEQIGYINAHGTGTLANDPVEARAIRDVFGAHTGRLAVSATKSIHGHTLGAAGALEGVATLLALRHGLLPPTANFIAPDPECALDVVPHEARAADNEYALSNSFAFGGLNAVLAFRRWNS